MPQSFSITDIGLRREMNQDYVFSSDLPLGPLSCLYRRSRFEAHS